MKKGENKVEYKVVGKAHPRLEAVEKTLGKAQYTDDFALPGMVYCMLLRSPYPYARVKKIDISRAEQVPGVVKILLPQDVPDKKYNNPSIAEAARKVASPQIRSIGTIASSRTAAWYP